MYKYQRKCKTLLWHRDGWIRVLRLFQQYLSHFKTMEAWTWNALCNETPFMFRKNLASSGIRTRDSVIRSSKSGALTARPRVRYCHIQIIPYIYYNILAMSWDYDTFCHPYTHSSNAHAQSSSGSRSLIFGRTLRLFVRTAKGLARLHGCAGSPEPSLVSYVISTIISWAGSFYMNENGTLKFHSLSRTANWNWSILNKNVSHNFTHLHAFLARTQARVFLNQRSFLRHWYYWAHSEIHLVLRGDPEIALSPMRYSVYDCWLTADVTFHFPCLIKMPHHPYSWRFHLLFQFSHSCFSF